MDPHRAYPPEEPDGQWYQPEPGYQEPEWDRPPPGYGEPPQQYGDYQGYQQEPRYTALTDPRPPDSGPPTGRMAPVGPRSGEPLPPMPAAPQLPPEAPPRVPPQSEPTSGLPHLGGEHGRSPGGLPPFGGTAGDQYFGGSADPGGEPLRHTTEQLDRKALRRPPGAGAPGPVSGAGAPGPLGEGVYRSRRPGTAAAVIAVSVVLEVIALRLLVAAFFGHPVEVGGSIASGFLALGTPMFGLGMYALLGGLAAAPGAGARAWLRPPLVYLPMALVLFVAAGLAAA